jgi:arylsulfatase A-like enzyme
MTKSDTIRHPNKHVSVILFIRYWALLSLVLIVVLAPYSEIQEQNLMQHKLYRTVAMLLQDTFFKTVLFSSVFAILLTVWSWFSRRSKSQRRGLLKRLQDKTSRSILFKAISLFSLIILLAINTTVVLTKLRQEPNVLFIVVDTLRSDYTPFGHLNNSNMPQLEKKLMPDSYVFKNAFSNSPWTLPSVSSLLTSQYPSRLNIKTLVSRLDNKNLTITELLKDRGYFTFGVVSHILLQTRYGVHQGFDIYNENNISTKFSNHYHISSPGITADAIQFIRKHKRRKFFMLLHYFDPHYTYINHDPTNEYVGEFTSRDMVYLRNLIREGQYTPKDLAYLKDSYTSEILLTDSYIGQVIDELKSTKLYDNTLIVFTSDHGEEFIEKGWLGHSTTVYNEQIKVPMLIKPPDSKSDLPVVSQSSYVSNIDITPSVLRILGISPISDFQGRDIFSEEEGSEVVFSEVTQREYREFINRACVIRDGWKLVYDFVNKTYELYDLVEDPGEIRNVLGSNDDVERSLKMKLAKWLKINRRPPKKTKEREALTEDEKQKLKSLGYIRD